MGEVVLNNGRFLFKPDDSLFVQIDLVYSKVKVNAGDIVQIRINSSDKPFKVVRGYVVKNLGNDRKVKGFNELYAITKERIPTVFPNQVLEAAALFNQTEVSLRPGYADLVNVPFVTIDGDSTRDYDDAVFATKLESGFSLKVAVADVSFYIPENSALDLEAKTRGTSVYLPEQVVPMLPEELSNGVCSLIPFEARLAVVCDMTIADDGTIVDYSFYRARIKSHARLTYSQVAKWISGEASAPSDIAQVIDDLSSVYQVLRELRKSFGFLEISRKEPKLLKDNGEPVGLDWVECTEAHFLVEDCMLAANKCAADLLIVSNKGAIFRHHATPSGPDWEEARAWFKRKGIELPEFPTLKDFSDVQDSHKGSDISELVDERLRRAMRPAVYDNVLSSHFSLGFHAYTHFTSPIRRYPDLMVHRAICAIVTNKDVALANDKELAEYCGEVSRRAGRAERFVWDRLKLKFIAANKGQSFMGKVVSSTASGCKVSILDWDIAGWLDKEDLVNAGFDWDAEYRIWIPADNANAKVLDLGQTLSVSIRDCSDIDLTLAMP
jgi:ribonuclease R